VVVIVKLPTKLRIARANVQPDGCDALKSLQTQSGPTMAIGSAMFIPKSSGNVYAGPPQDDGVELFLEHNNSVKGAHSYQDKTHHCRGNVSSKSARATPSIHV